MPIGKDQTMAVKDMTLAERDALGLPRDVIVIGLAPWLKRPASPNDSKETPAPSAPDSGEPTTAPPAAMAPTKPDVVIVNDGQQNCWGANDVALFVAMTLGLDRNRVSAGDAEKWEDLDELGPSR
jgi:hypothetical protein